MLVDPVGHEEAEARLESSVAIVGRVVDDAGELHVGELQGGRRGETFCQHARERLKATVTVHHFGCEKGA